MVGDSCERSAILLKKVAVELRDFRVQTQCSLSTTMHIIINSTQRIARLIS